MNIEDELREHLRLSTRALERADALRQKMVVKIEVLQSDVANARAATVLAEQARDTWIEAAVARVHERDVLKGQCAVKDWALIVARHVLKLAAETPGACTMEQATFALKHISKALGDAPAAATTEVTGDWPLPSIRRVVLRFAVEMERELRENDWKGGWDDEDPETLFESLEEEVDELDGAVDESVPGNDSVRAEAVDVANYAMMLADRSERMGEELPDDLQRDLDAILGRKSK